MSVDDLVWNETLNVLAVAQQRQRSFLETELKLCRTRLDFGRLELAVGNREFAARIIGKVVAAIQAYAKINSAGDWIDRTETVSLNQLFDRMSAQELEAHAQAGTLPDWFNYTDELRGVVNEAP